jgi:hypothetical protein
LCWACAVRLALQPLILAALAAALALQLVQLRDGPSLFKQPQLLGAGQA